MTGKSNDSGSLIKTCGLTQKFQDPHISGPHDAP